MGFRVLKGGMLTTVQDLGRTGYQSQGFSVSGVMDVRSFNAPSRSQTFSLIIRRMRRYWNLL